MALIDTVPTTKVVLPSCVAGHRNGELGAHLLRDFDGRGSLLTIVSYGMQALHIAAWADQIDGFGGIDTETVGRYRTLARQIAMLKERADSGPAQIPGRPWYRWWDGLWWSGKPGTAQVATPGTSNHGWAAADDVAEERTGDRTPDSMSDRQLAWMRDNAPSFGFGLETRKERWHWHWIAGDTLPARAIDVLRYCGIAIPADLAPPVKEEWTMTPTTGKLFDTRDLGGPAQPNQTIPLGIDGATQAFLRFEAIHAENPGFLSVDGGANAVVNFDATRVVETDTALVAIPSTLTVIGGPVHVKVSIQGVA